VSRRQRIRRTTLGALATGFGAAWFIAVSLVVTGSVPLGSAVLAALWVGGIGALVLTVAACGVEDDSTDDPAYFGSIIEGLRAEWQRPSRS